MGSANSNYGVAPFHPAFENYEFTMAMGEALGDVYSHDTVPLAMAILTSGHDSFLIQTRPRPQEHDSLEDTLLHWNHDPLEREARAERFANLRADNQEYAARANTEARRIRDGIRLPRTSPWEDAAGIAEGAAISFAEYGSHADLYANSSLAEPEFIPAGPPTRPCRFDNRRGVQRWRVPGRTEIEQAVAEAQVRYAHEQEIEREADKAYKKLRDKQSEHGAIFKTFSDLVNKWKADDPETHARFIKHMANAHMCSTANVRIWSIVSWFQKGTPLPIRQALDELVFHYLTEAWLATDLQELEAALGMESTRFGGPDSEIVGTELTDDDFWTVTAAAEDIGGPVWDSKTWLYGCQTSEPESHRENGFLHHVFKANAKTYPRHLIAHMEIRKVWLEHMGDWTLLNRKQRITMLLQWAPDTKCINGNELTQAEFDALDVACKKLEAWRADLHKALLVLTARAAAARRARIHGRDDDETTPPPLKRARTE